MKRGRRRIQKRTDLSGSSLGLLIPAALPDFKLVDCRRNSYPSLCGYLQIASLKFSFARPETAPSQISRHC